MVLFCRKDRLAIVKFPITLLTLTNYYKISKLFDMSEKQLFMQFVALAMYLNLLLI